MTCIPERTRLALGSSRSLRAPERRFESLSRVCQSHPQFNLGGPKVKIMPVGDGSHFLYAFHIDRTSTVTIIPHRDGRYGPLESEKGNGESNHSGRGNGLSVRAESVLPGSIRIRGPGPLDGMSDLRVPGSCWGVKCSGIDRPQRGLP